MTKIAFILLYILLSRHQELPPFETLQSPADLVQVVANDTGNPASAGSMSGTVNSVDLSPWAYDGSAIIRVQTSTAVEVVAIPARLNLCVAANNIAGLSDLKAGDQIEFKGERETGGIIVCGQTDHFLRVTEKTTKPTAPAPVEVRNTDVVMIDQERLIGGLVVAGNSLIEDSRCPADVQCVWAGQVITDFAFSLPNSMAPTLLKKLTLDAETIEVYGKQVRLIDVRPLSKSDRITPADDYQFTIEVK